MVLIQVWRPYFLTPNGAMSAPKTIPIPAMENAKARPAKPASG